MWRWKRQAAAGPDFSQLHDSIALKILQAVKEEPTSLLLNGGVVLHSRYAWTAHYSYRSGTSIWYSDDPVPTTV
jgi:hypothetical protein